MKNLKMTDTGLYEDDFLICSPFELLGQARTSSSEFWSILLRLRDPDNIEHEVLISNTDLLEQKNTLNKLVSLGLKVYAPKNKIQVILDYINNCVPEQKYLMPDNCGWIKNSFYLPNTNELFPIQNEKTLNTHNFDTVAKNGVSCDLSEWNTKLGYLLKNNSNLILAVTTVLAAPLLKKLNIQNYGFNFVGKSSKGKTTVCEYAASVIGSTNQGSSNYITSFRTTDNALESVAFGHNNCCLILDEFGQLDPDKAKDSVYLLGNGSTKNRSSKNGELRPKKEFSITFLSSSEITLREVISEAKQKFKSGLEVRLIDVESEVDEFHGCFEDIHNFKSSRELVDYIKKESKLTYGSLFNVFIRLLTDDLNADESILKVLTNDMNDFIKSVMLKTDSSTMNRIISSLALNYAVGKYAVSKGFLELDLSNLITCLSKVVHNIRIRMGDKNYEDLIIVKNIKDFILRFEETRFEIDDQVCNLPIRNRIGFIKHIGKEKCYLINGSGLEEICSLASKKQISSALLTYNLIDQKYENSLTESIYISNLKKSERFYKISETKLSEISTE